VQREPIRWDGRPSSARRPISQKTLKHYYSSLSVFFSWLASEGVISSRPLEGIIKPKAEQGLVQAFGEQEVKRLLSLCNTKSFLGIRNRAILMLFLDTGLRLSELASLRVSGIDFEAGYCPDQERQGDAAYFDDETWLDSRAGRRGKELQRGVPEILIAKHRQYGSGNRVMHSVWDGQKRQYRDYAGGRRWQTRLQTRS